jgi:predicted nucleic acid-binding protein
MAFVLDCSMTMAWVFPDEATEATDALRESLISDSAVVPALWPIEVANVLLVATRRGRIAEGDWGRLRRALAALPIDVDPTSAERVLEAVLPLASEHRISAYDAMYLELSLRLGLPLATLDRRLSAACENAGVKTLAAHSG